MNWQVIVVIVVTAFLFISLYKELMRPVMVFLVSVLVLLFSGIIDVTEALYGFSSENIMAIFLLYLLTEVITRKKILDQYIHRLFHLNLSLKRYVFKQSAITSFFSAFVNNTPLVALMIPYVTRWSERAGIAPSKVLIPLSYSTILGGTITLIGTSTNLVVNGFVEEAGLAPLKMFDFTIAGIIGSLLGILYLVYISTRLLPDRESPVLQFEKKTQEYIAETHIPAGSAYIGKTIEEAGLRNLKGLFLFKIIRNEKKISPVGPRELLQANDSLIFAGDTSTVSELVNGKDLKPTAKALVDHKLNIIECVVSNESDLIGTKVREADFREKYDGAIISISRDGERLSGKMGEVILKEGDLLLMVAGSRFSSKVASSKDLIVLIDVPAAESVKKDNVVIGLLSVAGFVLPALGYISLFKSLIILLCILALAGWINVKEVMKRTSEMEVILILILAMAIGKAVSNSGAGKLFAHHIISGLNYFHSPFAVLLAIYIICNILAMLVTNKAAVAIVFPIAMASAAELNVSHIPFALAVAFAGAAEFMTPYGYQTNLMVYGPGGYKFRDFIVAGFGLTIIFMLASTISLGYLYHLF